MKTLFVLASVMVVLFLATPNRVEAQKRKPTRLLEGKIVRYECGDNCYLMIVDKTRKQHTGLCHAKFCEASWAWKSMRQGIRERGCGLPLAKENSMTEQVS